MNTAEVRDLLQDKPVYVLEPHEFIRFKDGRRWVDVEIRDGRLTIRGSHPLVIRPEVSNLITIEV
jgi:hypothetical protein